MNVLVVTPWFPDEATQQEGSFVLSSVEALVAAGHRVHVLITRPYRPGSRMPDSSMASRGFTFTLARHISIPRNHFRFVSNWLYRAGCAPALARAVRSHNADVVHAHTEAAGVLACDVALGTPVVTTIHGINRSPRYLRGFGQSAFLRRAMQCPATLVIVGERLRDFVLAHGADPERTTVVANGFDGALAHASRGRDVLRGRVVRIVSVSNLVQGKGIETTLRALARARFGGFEDWRYDVIGDGPLRPELQSLARELGMAERVTFHGRVGRAQVFDTLSRSDIFCLPSSPEAFGIAYLEAMACGLLSIGCVGEGPASFIEGGKTGCLVSPGDQEALAALLVSVPARRSEFARIAAKGQERVWADFTWERHAALLESVFERAIAGFRP